MTHHIAPTTAPLQHSLLAQRIRAMAPQRSRREVVVLVALGLAALAISLTITFLDPSTAFALPTRAILDVAGSTR